MQYEKWLDFDSNPLYALMHESIYCQVKLFLIGNVKFTGIPYIVQYIIFENLNFPISINFWLTVLYLHHFSFSYLNLILCDKKGASSSWSAHKIRAENESQFDAMKAVKEGRPVLFTGEVRNRSIFTNRYSIIHAPHFSKNNSSRHFFRSFILI